MRLEVWHCPQHNVYRLDMADMTGSEMIVPSSSCCNGPFDAVCYFPMTTEDWTRLVESANRGLAHSERAQ